MDESCERDATWRFHTYFFETRRPIELPYGHGYPCLCAEHAEAYEVWVFEHGGSVTARTISVHL